MILDQSDMVCQIKTELVHFIKETTLTILKIFECDVLIRVGNVDNK